MPIVTVLYGHAYDGKNEDAFRKCLEKIQRNEGDTCIYLVRSDVRVRQLRDVVLREFSGCFSFPVATFPDFIKTLYRKSSGTRRVIGDLEQKLLIEDILKQREQECGSQFYFSRFRNYPGILGKVREFIAEVRRVGIVSPQELAERIRNCSDRWQQVYDELVNVFECYVERLVAANIIDDTGIFLDVARRAVSNQLDIRSWVASPELLVLEGYYELTLPEQQILNSLCSQFARSILTLDTPLNPYNFPEEAETPKPFRVFREIVQYIQTSGFSLREFSDKYLSPRDSEGQRNEPFDSARHDPIEKCFATLGLHRLPSEQKLSTKSYRDRKEEVTEIAREIRRLHREGNIIALRDVGVTFPVIEQYEQLVCEIFPLFGIPFTMFQGYPLASSPVVVTIFRLLQVVIDDYSRETLRKLFSSPLVQFEIAEEDLQNKFCTPFAPLNSETYHHLDSLARFLGIVGGKQEWEEKLTQYKTDLEQQKTEDRRQETEDRRQETGDRRQKTEGRRQKTEDRAQSPLEGRAVKFSASVRGEPVEPHQKSALRQAQGERYDPDIPENLTALPLEGGRGVSCLFPPSYSLLPAIFSLLNFLSRFETEGPWTPENLIDWLLEAIQQFQIPQQVLRSKQREILEHDVSALQAFLRILETLKRELSSGRRHNVQPYPLTLKEFFDLVRIAVQGETYYPPETFNDSVFVMGRLDPRQVQFKYLFFGGLVEKDFPGQDEPNIFLSDQELQAFGLPTYKKRIQETDHLFYLHLLNPTEKLYLSYPLQEGETELLRSAYIDRVLDWQTKVCTPGEDSGVQTLVCNLNLENVFTYSELYQWLGRQFLGAQASCLSSMFHSPSAGEVLRFIETEKGRGYVANFLNGLQAQRLRTADELGHFDGILSTGWSKAFLHHGYAKHIYSVSEFDQYVRCPVRFFFQRLLHLEPLQDIAIEIPALEIGTLLHRIVYRFYASASGGQNLFCLEQDESCTPRQNKFCPPTGNVDEAFLKRRTEKEQWIREACSRMFQIVCEELKAYNFSGVFWERFANLLLVGLNKDEAQDVSYISNTKQGLLAAFIELEANDPDKVIPCYLDAHFGMRVLPEERNRQNELRTPEETGYILSVDPFQVREKDADGRMVTIKIRGAIDRIDLEPIPEKGKRRVVIYDYKTGSVPSVQNIKNGLSFQLPLYLLAVQEFLGEEYEVVAGGYYQLQSPNNIGKKGLFGSKEYSEQRYFKGFTKSLFETHAEFLRMLEEYKTRAVRTAQAIKQGRFHPTILGSLDAGCDYCEYNQICRVDHQKMSHFQSNSCAGSEQ
jgi:ATP-dependent helicase/DNAse subunit B